MAHPNANADLLQSAERLFHAQINFLNQALAAGQPVAPGPMIPLPMLPGPMPPMVTPPVPQFQGGHGMSVSNTPISNQNTGQSAGDGTGIQNGIAINFVQAPGAASSSAVNGSKKDGGKKRSGEEKGDQKVKRKKEE